MRIDQALTTLDTTRLAIELNELVRIEAGFGGEVDTDIIRLEFVQAGQFRESSETDRSHSIAFAMSSALRRRYAVSNLRAAESSFREPGERLFHSVHFGKVSANIVIAAMLVWR